MSAEQFSTICTMGFMGLMCWAGVVWILGGIVRDLNEINRKLDDLKNPKDNGG